jgi:hypothetical protein
MIKVSLAAITVSTREYEFSHGRKPRGYGHWAFWMGRRSTHNIANAARQATRKAQELRHTAVTVGKRS